MKKILIVFLVLFVLLVAMWLFTPVSKSLFTIKGGNVPVEMHQCSMGSCNLGCSSGEIANISDPAFNMREVCKQSLLLEDHLVQKEKRCRDCICKHFLLCVSLLEEAVWLAGDKVSEYPLLSECVPLYNDLFKEWLKNQENVERMLEIATQLRSMRKQIAAEYFLKQDGK
jgi:hypothetical protein